MTQRTLLVAVALCAAASVAAGQSGGFVDASGHASSLVSVDGDVRLEVLDWGGTGPPMVFLAGLGNTAPGCRPWSLGLRSGSVLSPPVLGGLCGP